VAELDVIEARYGGPVDRTRFYRHVARVSLRVSWFSAALRYYVQGAVADPEYRRSAFAHDVMELAQEASHAFRRRVTRALMGAPPSNRTRPARGRYAPHRPWLEEARPWLDELASRRSDVGPASAEHTAREISRT
jgi:hypothetical protein